MFFQRYYLECLSHASYLIADEETKIAVVIDPQRDIDLYVQTAEENGFHIKHVILTHFHADFVSGHIELRDKYGATIYFGAQAKAEFDFHPLHDNDTLEFGNILLKIWETPGHTPEGISVLLFDKTKSSTEPYAVFTGDTLFLGDVGRPDLLASIGMTANELAEMLYQSLHEKLLTLPDETLIYPAHGAGSMCGKQLSNEEVSTIRDQKKHNYALQPMSKESFVEMITADQPEAPAYFGHDAMLNRQERASLGTSLSDSLKALSLDEVLDLQKSGAQVLDVREAVEFANGHLKETLNVGLDGKYATWAGTVLTKEKPIVVIADPSRAGEAIMRLGRIGFDQVKGYLKQGMEALRDHPELMSNVLRVDATSAHEKLSQYAIIDVRTEKEWKLGHIPDSLNFPLNRLQDKLSELPTDRTLLVHCQGGYRSSLAASILQHHGIDNVGDLIGGYKAWVQAGFEYTEPEGDQGSV